MSPKPELPPTVAWAYRRKYPDGADLGPWHLTNKDPRGLLNGEIAPIAALEPLCTIADASIAIDAAVAAAVAAERERCAQTDALRDVTAERRRQIESESWTPEHDDEHKKGEMAKAAACYAMQSAMQAAIPSEDAPALWPSQWDTSWWRPTSRRRNLVKAAALLLAEIERLDRADAIRATAPKG